jgi:glycosyltransferase involved in cell wall biosynthesis
VFGYPSGLLAYQRALAHHLPEIAQSKHFVLLRQQDAPGRLSYSPNAHELFVEGDPETPWAPLLTGMQLRLEGVELFHATTGLYPRGVRAPVVTTIHDLLWLTQPSMIRPVGVMGRLQAALARSHVVKALQESVKIIVPSLATKREIERVAPFAADRVVHIPHGVSEQFVPLEAMSEKAKMLSRQAVDRLLFGAPKFVMDVGRAAPYRNHEGLIRGFAMAFRGDDEVHLVLVQPLSPRASRLMQLADKVGIGDRLHILSGVSSKHLVALYQHASCVCHPTLHEAYGSVVAEAMACGTPVVATKVGGLLDLPCAHADPHPGNILVDPDSGAIILLDFGAVAELSDDMREGIPEFLEAVVRRDNERLLRSLHKMHFIARGSDREVSQRVVEYLHQRFQEEIRLESFNFKDIKLDPQKGVENLLDLRKMNIGLKEISGAFQVPRDWVLLERTLLLLIGVCTQLDASLNPMDVIRPYVHQFVLGNRDWAQIAIEAVKDMVMRGLALPDETHRYLQKATHDFDYLMYLMGQPIVRVAATATRTSTPFGFSPILLSPRKTIL